MAHRYFVPSLPSNGPCSVDGDLAHHLGRVLRVQAGEEIRLGDGRGGTAICRVRTPGKQRVELEVLRVASEPPVRPQLVLAFAPPKAQRMDWLLEHGTELGIAEFAPVWTERTRPQGERIERWQRIVQAAAGQCDRAWLPTVREPIAYAEFLRAPLPGTRVLADAEGGALSIGSPAAAMCLLVGPEGGFSGEERTAALAAGFVPMRFGPHVLRTETAAALGAGLLLAHAAR